MKKIRLANSNLCALVDEKDFAFLSQFVWKADVLPNGTRAYTHIKGKWTGMHRLIMHPPERLVVDHINMDQLDNRRRNLRVCTVSQNLCNRGKNKNNRSGYKGVVYISFGKRVRRWKAQIKHHRKSITLGYFLTPEEAAQAYNTKAQELFGKFARLNSIQTSL